MKKWFLLLPMMAIISFTFVSCGSDDDDDVSGPSLTTNSITMYAGESKVISNSSDATWTSSNEFVATVEGGVVKGQHVGNTTVTAISGGKTVRCKVTVDAKYTMITEPIIEFGLSMSQIKSREKNTLRDETSTSLTYVNNYNSLYGTIIGYQFENGKLSAVNLMINHQLNTSVAKDLASFFQERYMYVSTEDGFTTFVNGPSGKFDMVVMVEPTNSKMSNYMGVIYAPFTRSSASSVQAFASMPSMFNSIAE